LSAGERQLLAVSLLWGLARASGQPLPVVVDTPLGRLDGSHREHLVERYFPYASHQVILLSTDTEIDEATYQRMKKFVGRSYQLVFDQVENATSVVPGYFWK
jgi:DNA sulfur modification protein DndD